MAKHRASEAAKLEPFMTLLRRYRLAAGLTQTQIARELKVVPSTVSFWESGDSIPSPRMIPELAKLLNIDAVDLTKLIDPPPAPRGASAA